jgi:8-oxo-dGTP pyrophosphatase MutT (NUDIX family)
VVLADDVLIGRIGERLLATPESIADGAVIEPDWMPDEPFERPPVPAAVLIALLRRPEGLTVLYTERSGDLRSHSGQVAFPGGKIDPTDAGPADAALREANEEVALDPADARVIGYMPSYFTGSNYLITPVVAEVEPRATFVPNPLEVKAIFEVPLRWLADEESYSTYHIHRGGRHHTTWQIEHNGFRIWGITANLTRGFHDLALSGESEW